jgi:glutaredoxin/glutathione-dependent peroxiredoxin
MVIYPKFSEILAQGVDSIVCLSINDPHVMQARGEQNNVDGKIQMIANGNGDFTRAIGMGIRSQRYPMIVENSTVVQLNLKQPGKFGVSDAETILASLGTS